MESPQWKSSLAKYLMAAGFVFFVIGLKPFNNRTGRELWYTDFVKMGSEHFAGFTSIQIGLMIGGISLIFYGVYHERVLA